MMVVRAVRNSFQKYVEYCVKHEWIIYLVGIVLGITIGFFITPVKPLIENFIDNTINFFSNMVGAFFVLLIMIIGVFIEIIAKIFR